MLAQRSPPAYVPVSFASFTSSDGIDASCDGVKRKASLAQAAVHMAKGLLPLSRPQSPDCELLQHSRHARDPESRSK